MRIREAVPADAGPMARVHVDTWRTAYTGIVPAGHLAVLSYHDMEARWVHILTGDEPAECNVVAETQGGEIVGFAGGGPERERRQDLLGRALRRLPAARTVDGQRKCPPKWPAKMSLELLAMVSGHSVLTVGRFIGGLSACMYFFAVSRWMASSRATLRIDRPLRFAFCTAFHLAV